VSFGLFGTFAQLSASTSRVIIINYSMPIWASLMAWLLFRERITSRVALGLALCLGGLAVLVYPVWAAAAVTLAFWRLPLEPAIASLPAQVAHGFTTFCIKPSQFVDDLARYPAWCREVVERVGEVGG